MSVVTKAALIDAVAEDQGMTVQSVRGVLESLLKNIGICLECGDDVMLRGFGMFSIRKSPPLMCRNPKTGERFEVPSKWRVKFKPYNKLKERANA